MEYLSYSVENNYFGGDCSILLEFSQFLDMLWCIFFHKNQSFCLRLFAKCCRSNLNFFFFSVHLPLCEVAKVLQEKKSASGFWKLKINFYSRSVFKSEIREWSQIWCNVCFKKTMTHLLLYTVVSVSSFFWNRRYSNAML